MNESHTCMSCWESEWSMYSNYSHRMQGTASSWGSLSTLIWGDDTGNILDGYIYPSLSGYRFH